MSESLGSILARLRRRRGWSQREAATHAPLSRAYIGFVERGLRNPGRARVQALLRAYEASDEEQEETWASWAQLHQGERDRATQAHEDLTRTDLRTQAESCADRLWSRRTGT